MSPLRVCPQKKPLLRIRGATQTITRKTLPTKLQLRSCKSFPNFFQKKFGIKFNPYYLRVDYRFFHRFGFMDLGNPPVFLYGRLFLVNNNNKIYDTNNPATTCRWRRYL